MGRVGAPGSDGLDGTDALALLDCIEACHACRSREAFQALFPRIRALLPFEHSLAVVGRLDDGAALAVDGINNNFPEAWLRPYTAAGGFARDALVRHNLATHEAVYWSETTPGLARPNALALCLDCGLRQGWVAGAAPVLSGRDSSLFCFAGATGRRDRRTEAVLRHLVPHLHLALVCAVERPAAAWPAPVLSPREKEVLDWLKEGKRSWDIAVILGIGERTVNFHVANILDKLGVTNRTQAVAVALARGLIALD